MNEFEITNTEHPREKIYLIEKSDEDYFRRPDDSFDYPKLTPMNSEDLKQEINNAKSKSERAKKKPRKIPSKRNKTTVA